MNGRGLDQMKDGKNICRYLDFFLGKIQFYLFYVVWIDDKENEGQVLLKKARFVFQISQSPQKIIPKNYPELEI